MYERYREYNIICYLCSLLDKHIKERKRGGGINDGWLKDLLLKYVNYFRQIFSHLEININICIYGQGGFLAFTYKEMWGLYRQHKHRFVIS